MNQYIDKRFIAFANISLLSNKLQMVMNIGMKEITPRQWLILIIIGKFDEPPTLKELSARCGIAHQSAKQLLERLVEKGYVLIKSDEKDRRSMRIFLTDRARRWSEENAKRNTEFVYGLFDGLTEKELEIYCKTQFILLSKLEEIERAKGENDI
jgi:DNA-binding MarR family transcriptional regulator